MKQITLQTSVLYAHTQKLLLVGVFVVLSALLILQTIVQPVQAATSDTINFQARLQQSSGALVPDGFYNVEFKLYNTETLGSALWTETYYDANGATAGSDARVRVANGYVTVNLGSQTAFPGTINWSEQHWLTMNIGGTTQTASPTWDGEMSPRLKLTAVPYAFSAGQLQETTGSNTSTLGFATQTAANSILLPDASGTICLQNNAACGFMTGSAADYIQNGTTPQTADFNITGGGTIGGLLNVSGAGTSLISDNLKVGDSTSNYFLAQGGNSGRGMASNVVISSGDGGSGRAAFYVKGGLAGNSFEAGGTSDTSAKITTSANNVGLMIQGSSSQVADLLVLADSTAATVASISAVGDMNVQNVVLGAAKSITLTGGNTASRPASPTEGMVYFDTTTKQLLTFANGKWQADRSTATKIVAASNSSQAAKDAADYVATGTGDQATINAALTAAAGGKVYLIEGIYSINAVVTVPQDTSLTGSGSGSVIEIADNFNADILSMVTLNAGSNLTKLKIDGNFTGQDSATILNTPYIQVAVTIAGSNVHVDSVEIDDIITAGININGTSQSNIVITNNKIHSGNAIELNTTPDGFTIQNNILTATMSGQPGNGIDIAAGAYNGTISGNTITGNGYGVKLSGAENMRVSENNISNMGGSTANNAIFLEGSMNNFITNNVISDTSATTTNYAIDISESFSSNNYLADNVLGSGTINDAGTGTIFASQLDENGKLINKATDGLQIQDAAGVNLFDADSTDSRITIGVADANTTLFVLDGSSAATDPATAPDGSMYYNTTMNEFRCRINGAWANCGGTSGGANFQQGGNSFGATATIGTTDAYGVNIITNGSTVASLTSTGAANFKNVSDSANAFRVQNASNVSVFNINTTDSQVLVGTADSNATLFVLDTKDTDGDPATGVDGAMYYNSFMDEFRCYIAGAWTGCGGSGGGGGGGASRMAILIPEYAGGTLQADGTSNAGVMNADFVSGLSLAEGYKHNYYQWTSSNTTAQDYNIIVNTQVPTEYVSGLSNLKIWAYSSSTTLATGTIQFTDVDGTTCYGGPVSFTPSVANTWEQKSVGAMTNCVFSGNDIVTITISVVAEDNEVIRVGEISYEYTN